MAKKFFYNRVYNTKRTIINLVVIGVCIIGVIVCFIITSNFQGESHNTPEGTLSIKSELTVEVNDNIKKELFFSKIENVDLDKIEIIYPDNYNISNPGRYSITLIINEKEYSSALIVVDTLKPELELQNLTINTNEAYTAKDFVKSCYDNGNQDCIISFYNGVDADGNKTDYSNYTKKGIYAVKILALDSSGNQTIKESTLTIKDKNDREPNTPSTINCKYGNNVYNTDKYLVAMDITTNKCAVSLDLYKDAGMTSEINKLMESESTRIIKDVNALNLNGTLALSRLITAVINTTGNGIVGYELRMTVRLTKDDITETVADYKIDSNGKREFITNPYKISK